MVFDDLYADEVSDGLIRTLGDGLDFRTSRRTESKFEALPRW
jgi:hypothetical protein